MVTLHGRGPTSTPLAGQAQIVCAFASDMSFAHMVLSGVSKSAEGVIFDVV